jgi:choline dehydrogenase-like flavoprotein
VSLSYDVVIIGSGAGGGTMAHALASTGARILIVERGGPVPQEPENWDPVAVWKQLRYRATEKWLDATGAEFLPYTHYGLGGNTKFRGSVLYRLRREDFGEIQHADGVSPAWPIDYDTLAPWYDRAEQLYHVHGEAGADPTDPPRGPFPHAPIPHSSGMSALVTALEAQGLHPSPLPLGLIRPGEDGGSASTATARRASVLTRSRVSRAASIRCSSPPTSRRAASMSRRSRTSSTLMCRWRRPTTSTASGALAAPR